MERDEVKKVLEQGPIRPGKTGKCIKCGRTVTNPTSQLIQPYCQEHS